MVHISKRSLKASKEGIQLASRAILRFPTKIDFAAELEISRSTVQNFFAGKPVGRENFHKICQELDLLWQEVAELPPEVAKLPKPTVISNEITENNQLAVNIGQQDNGFSPICPSFIRADSLNGRVEAISDSVVEQFRDLARGRIWSMCGTMRVLDMSCPKLTENIYVDTKVYLKIKGRRRLKVDALHSFRVVSNAKDCDLEFNDDRPKQVEILGDKAAMCYSKLIVLGKPGSGKTMFLKHLTLQCLEGGLQSDRIPIFVPLRDFVAYTSSLDLVDYISNQLAEDCQIEINLVRQLLNRGKFLIVLDGLDEVKFSNRSVVCQHLRRFTKWFPHNYYIISCRHGVQCCNFEQFTEVEIADFKPRQIEDFAVKWFEPENTQLSCDFLTKVIKNNLIQEFATNPLLLVLLCIVFEESADFPVSRAEIYEEGLDIMLKQWDAERAIEREQAGGLTLQQEKELLCKVARRTFERKEYFFKETELKFYIADYATNLSQLDISRIDAQKVLKSIEAKHGLLVEQAKKVYSFSHLAFQEYLTAKEFVAPCDLAVSIAMLNHLVSHLTEERWHEIFLLVAEMSPQADQLFSIMSQKIDDLGDRFTQITAFLEWVNCKTESIIIPKSEPSQEKVNLAQTSGGLRLTECQKEVIRVFYYSMGFGQILGSIGTNFSLMLKLDPHFGEGIAVNADLALDLSLFNLLNLMPILESIHNPALILQRSLKRAISHAIKIEPELTKELQRMKQRISTSQENETQFWLWWHQEGKAWFSDLNSMAMKYRNIAHQWNFNSQQQEVLQQYFQANLLLLDCLDRSSYVSSEVRDSIRHQLLKPTKSKTNHLQDTEQILQSNIAYVV